MVYSVNFTTSCQGISNKPKCNGPKRIFATAISITCYTYLQSLHQFTFDFSCVKKKPRGHKSNAQSDRIKNANAVFFLAVSKSEESDQYMHQIYTQIKFIVTRKNSKCKCSPHFDLLVQIKRHSFDIHSESLLLLLYIRHLILDVTRLMPRKRRKNTFYVCFSISVDQS